MRRRAVLAATAGVVGGCLGVSSGADRQRAPDPWREVESTQWRGYPAVEGRAVLPAETFADRTVAPEQRGRFAVEFEATAPIDFAVFRLGEYDRYRLGRSFAPVGTAEATSEQRAQVRLPPGEYRWVFDNTAAFAAPPREAVEVSFRAAATGV